MKNFNIKDFIAGYITPLLVLVTAIYGFINNQKTAEMDHAIHQIEVQNKSRFDSLLLVEKSKKLEEFDREFNFRIYADVKKAVLDGNEQVQFVTADFVAVMVKDEVFRDALLKSLVASHGTSENVKKALQANLSNENVYQMEQKSLQNELKSMTKMNSEVALVSTEIGEAKIRIDIFYLEETATKYSSKKKAESIQKGLDKEKYDVKVRVLPRLTNTKPAYSISQNQIRFEKGESKIAEFIKQQAGGEFILNEIGYSTPNYISVFVYN